MPVFDMKCIDCSFVMRDKFFTSLDKRKKFYCERCSGKTKALMPDHLMINLDSTFEGYDEVLETYLRGGTHRKEVMKEKGLVERDKVTERSDKGKWV